MVLLLSDGFTPIIAETIEAHAIMIKCTKEIASTYFG